MQAITKHDNECAHHRQSKLVCSTGSRPETFPAVPLNFDVSVIGCLDELGDAPLLPEHFQGQWVQPDQARQRQQSLGAAAGIFIMQ